MPRAQSTAPSPEVARPNSGDLLVDAALEILARHGFAGLTIAEVSRVSGVSNGSLYHRFGGREGLLNACQDRFFQHVSEQWLTEGTRLREEQDPQVLLEVLVDSFDEIFGRNRNLFQAFMVTGFHEAALRERGARFTRDASSLLADILIEWTGCTPAAADTAYRLLFGHAVLGVMFTDDEVTANPAARSARRALVLEGLKAIVSVRS